MAGRIAATDSGIIKRNALRLSLVAIASVFAFEFVAGIFTNSLALITDGAHALLWYSVWDDDAAADRFAAAMERVLAGPLARTGTVERLEVDGRSVVRVTIGARPLSAPIPPGAIHLSFLLRSSAPSSRQPLGRME